MPRTKKALTVAAFGARGTGKTAWVRQFLQRETPTRLAVWDFKHDPALRDMGTAYTSLPEFIRAMHAGAFQARYLVDHAADIHAAFDVFCRACWHAGNITMFVDELPEVTKPGKAPTSWRRCVNVGREYTEGGKLMRLSIVGAGQRPAECDKSFIANCDIVHCGRLGHGPDAEAMARSMGVKALELQALPDLAWIEKRADRMEVERGTLTFSGNKAEQVQKKPVRPHRPKTPSKA
jgi:hypothetical protein